MENTNNEKRGELVQAVHTPVPTIQYEHRGEQIQGSATRVSGNGNSSRFDNILHNNAPKSK